MAAGIKLEFDLFIISSVWNYLVVIRERSDRITGERSSPLSHSFLLSFFLSLSYLEMSIAADCENAFKKARIRYQGHAGASASFRIGQGHEAI